MGIEEGVSTTMNPSPVLEANMSVLILNRMPLARYPYSKWLADGGQRLHLLTHSGKLERFGEALPVDDYASAQAFDNYDHSGEVELAALEIAKRETITSIIAQGENDLERAARLRRQLGLAGQDEASAEAFRDKATMRAKAREGGVSVPDWVVVDSTKTMADFVAHHGYPVVLKPRRGSGSIGVTIIRNDDELRVALAAGTTDPLRSEPFFLVERFVEGILYHADGLVLDGKPMLIWPSSYAKASCSLDYRTREGDSIASFILDPQNSMTKRLQDFTAEVLEALPTPRHTAFHAEIFHTPDDRLVLCEIGSRTGGGRIVDGLAAGFDMSLAAEWARAECGLAPADERLPCDALLRPRRLSGWGNIAPSAGLLVSAPEECSLPGYREFSLHARPGELLDDPQSVVDVVASFVFSADSEAEADEKVGACRRWFWDTADLRQPSELRSSL